MFVILVSYQKPLEEIDRLIPAHRQFLAQQVAAGKFLLAGRQQPRMGGVILAQAKDKAEVEAIVAQDPFKIQGAADYRIIEFLPVITAPHLGQYQES